MAVYFQGGDCVELLSAQGKAPASKWKLQGKISKTFDKGIKGNTFQLEGSSETKMQLPKASASALNLAQRFVVLQVFVPFTRSFSVEICFSDFQKVRRRFVAASAFRETTRTALHVQLPLSALDIPREEWMNLVFDLETLSEMHFPDSGYRSMESICIGGSCRLKRVFTMKDAPTPSRGSQIVKHAEIRAIPRQFEFSATRGSSPVSTLYFGLKSALKVDRVAVTVDKSTIRSGTIKSSRRSQTAVNTRMKVPAVRPASELQPGEGHQRLKTRVRVDTAGSQRSKLGKVITRTTANTLQEFKPPDFGVDADLSSIRIRAFEEDQLSEATEKNSVNSLVSVEPEEMKSPMKVKSKSLDCELKPTRCSLMSCVKDEEGRKSDALRHSIMGEIQQKLASLEDDEERQEQRNRELFLRHSLLHSGDWHLDQLGDNSPCNGDDLMLSDEEDEQIELSSSWRREDALPRRLFDFDSLLQDTKPSIVTEKELSVRKSVESSHLHEVYSESFGADADDVELTKLLAAKRAARASTLELQATTCEIPKLSREREEWVLVDSEANKSQDKEWHLTSSAVQEEDSEMDVEDEENALSMDFELSASGENFCDDERRTESDHESCKSLHDDESSFDFEDLVEDAESINSRDEDEEKHENTPVTTVYHLNHHEIPQLLPSVQSPKLKSLNSATRSKTPTKSPPDRSIKSSASINLSSSFSSRRLQKLLESTDWTAELHAQASTKHSSSPLVPPSTQPKNQSQKSVQRPSPPRRTLRKTPSSSSVDLVYDPLLRCYYDPIAKKYYALAD